MGRGSFFVAVVIFCGALAAIGQQLDTIQLSSTNYTVVENSGPVTIRLERTGPRTDHATLQVRTEMRMEGYGNAGTNDFQPFSRTVTFAPGQSELTVAIEILNDALGEQNESFQVVLSDPDPFCCQLGSNTRATVLIQDNDPGVQFGSNMYLVNENAGELQINVSRFGDMTNHSGSIAFQIQDGSAANGIDFILENGQVTFSAGQTNAIIRISIINDAVFEYDETFRLQLEPNPDALCCPVGYPQSTIVWINDNDRGVEFARIAYEGHEGERLGEPTAIEIQVQRIGDPTNEFRVDLELAGTATAGADFVLSTNRLYFPSGTSNVLALIVRVLDDPIVEGHEYVNLYLTNSMAGVPIGRQSMCRFEFFDNEYPVSMLDPAFASPSVGRVTAALTQADGKILFVTYNDYRAGLGRLNPDGSLDAGFAAFVTNAIITTLAMQSGGKILGAGTSSYYGPRTIVRVLSNGERDASFVPPSIGAGYIRCLLVLPDGKILIGGIIHIDGTPAAVVRLHQSGGWDASFNVALNVGTPMQPQVFAMALQVDGKIVIGGDFVSVDGEARFNLARLFGNGSFDPTFNAGLDQSAVVSALALQSDGRLLAVISNNRLVRVNGATGANDPSFQPQLGSNSRIEYLTLQPDGKILLLGELFSPDQNRLGAIARLNPDGSLDGFSSAIGSAFVAEFNGQIFTAHQDRVVRLLPEPPRSTFCVSSNKMYAWENGTSAQVTILRGGNSSSTLSVDFSTAGDATPGLDFIPSSGTVTFQPLETTKTIAFQPVDDCRAETNEMAELALINPSPEAVISQPGRATLMIMDDDAAGSLDVFNPSLFSARAIALQQDGRIVVGGMQGIDRLNADGSRDPSFTHASVGIGSDIYSIVLQPDGKILAAGDGSIIRLHANGIWDGNFRVSAIRRYCPNHGDCYDSAGTIANLLLQPDGRIIAIGDFYKINEYPCRGLARLNADSTVDRGFTANAAGLTGFYPPAVALQRDGKLVVESGSDLVRLNVDGRQDTTFGSIFPTGGIRALAILPNQAILIGGGFTSVKTQIRPALARINRNGSLDTNFSPVIVVEGLALRDATALAVTKDGSILVAGHFSDGTVRLVKLDSEGSLVPSFNSGLRFSGSINSIIEQPDDGELLVAGSFDSVNGMPRPGIARLKSERSHIRMTPLALQTDGFLRITTGTQVGNTYVLQSSVDLTVWADRSTKVANGCTLDFEDLPPSPGARFYRVLKSAP